MLHSLASHAHQDVALPLLRQLGLARRSSSPVCCERGRYGARRSARQQLA